MSAFFVSPPAPTPDNFTRAATTAPLSAVTFPEITPPGDPAVWPELLAAWSSVARRTFIPPSTKHTLVNNSSAQEVKHMEFYSPIAPDTVQVEE
jgi:hypothetical protein